MSRVIPERSAKAGAAGKGGGPDQYTGTWGLSQYRRRMKYLLVLNVCGSFATQLRSAGDWVAGCRCGGFTIG
ncbi:hypothetical protein HBI25_205300 [Parastagonospora nodorum]|nr:hypothetical protein HBI09_186940 [Parastagonospora nodorum]KAH4193829.1 hypothetical protein HBI95_201630 [Parastagonospora nodorum]KAH5145249.1 hypothetical protein HBH69_184570 [Parastagonospora nodorum]KAH5409177.1 hypothetical protein HBI47_167300 [Parastagonospora nodorum]KAH5547910.1 hypothetical protein HBI25_205300 [Parastagonospora nodorum]